MPNLTTDEREAVNRAQAEPMLEQVMAWSAINSGSRNLAGLGRMAESLADAFTSLAGHVELVEAGRVEAALGHVAVPSS